MTRDRDIERLLTKWLADGPVEAPERVLDVAAGRIHSQRQRPAWLLTRRVPAMSGTIRLLAVAAVLVGALAIGSALFMGGGQAGPTPPPTPGAPPASAAPTVEAAVATPRPFTASDVLAAGPYVAQFERGTLALTLDDGWGSLGSSPQDLSLRRLEGPADDTVKVFADMRRAAKDAACTEAPEPGIGFTADELLADFRTDDQLAVTGVQDVTLDGMTGVRFDVRLAPGASRTCPFSGGARTVPLVVDDVAGEGHYWGIGEGEAERVYLLDTAGGHNIVIVIDSAAGASIGALTAAAEPVIATMAWTPDPSATFECSDGTTESCAGPLDAGTVSTKRFQPAFTATLPSSFDNTFDIARTYSLAPKPHVYDLQVLSQLAIPEQNADCSAAAKPGAGTTVDDWVSFITTHPGLVANTPVPVTVGGHPGMRVQFRVADDWPERCPNSIGPAVVLFTDSGSPPARSIWFDDHRVTAWIVDVDGETVIIHVDSGPSLNANDDDVRTVTPIIESISFEPGT